MLLLLDTFQKKEKKDGVDRLVDVTYKDYFERRYRVKIYDVYQPLLISIPKDKDRRGGNDVIINTSLFFTRRYFCKSKYERLMLIVNRDGYSRYQSNHIFVFCCYTK